MSMSIDLAPSGQAFEYDVTYCEGVTKAREEPWRGYGVRYRPVGEHRLRVFFMDGREAQPPSSTMVLLAIDQHYRDDEAGELRR